MLWSQPTLILLILPQLCFSRYVPTGKSNRPRQKNHSHDPSSKAPGRKTLESKPSQVYGDDTSEYWRVQYALRTVDFGDEPWQRERARVQQDFANTLREELKNLFPDKGEFEISSLQRLYRVALYSIKDDAPPKDLEWAQRWRKWWRTIKAPYTFDTRSAPEEFLAYTMDRKSGAISETPDIFDFEELFNDEYLQFLECHVLC